MNPRLWAFALVIVIAGSTLAPVLCRVTCASQEIGAATTSAEHHSCHETAAAGSRLRPLAHPCGHQNDGVIGLLELTQVLIAPAIVMSSAHDLLASDDGVQRAFTRQFGSSPPTSALLTPLRV